MSISRTGAFPAVLIVLLASAPAFADETFSDPTITVTVEAPVVLPVRFDSKIRKLADGSLCVCGFRSTDGGKTWSEPSPSVGAAFSGKWRHVTGCALRDGTYLGIGMMAEFSRLDQHVLKIYTSGDNLNTITGPTDATLHIPQGTGGYVETGEFGSGTYVDHGMIESRDGRLIATCYGWWWGDEAYSMLEKYVPELGMYKYRSWVIASEDRGKTWEVLGSPGYCPELGPEGMCEPGLVELANDDLLMLFRNGEGSQPCFQSRSKDGGKAWSKPEKLNSTGSWPTPCLLSNGLLVAAHGRPNFYLWISPDGEGKAWTSRTLVAKGGRGYASVVEATPGELVFTGFGQGKPGLHIWRIRVERTGDPRPVKN